MRTALVINKKNTKAFGLASMLHSVRSLHCDRLVLLDLSCNIAIKSDLLRAPVTKEDFFYDEHNFTPEKITGQVFAWNAPYNIGFDERYPHTTGSFIYAPNVERVKSFCWTKLWQDLFYLAVGSEPIRKDFGQTFVAPSAHWRYWIRAKCFHDSPVLNLAGSGLFLSCLPEDNSDFEIDVATNKELLVSKEFRCRRGKIYTIYSDEHFARTSLEVVSWRNVKVEYRDRIWMPSPPVFFMGSKVLWDKHKETIMHYILQTSSILCFSDNINPDFDEAYKIFVPPDYASMIEFFNEECEPPFQCEGGLPLNTLAVIDEKDTAAKAFLTLLGINVVELNPELTSHAVACKLGHYAYRKDSMANKQYIEINGL